MQIQVRGLRMAYEDTGGQGVPLVLIHGFPLDRTYWAKQVEALADVARVIAPDLRGCGESGLPAGSVTMDTYADDVRGLLDALGVKNAVVAGLSMGGYISFAFYRKFAHRVRALVLADTRAAADSPEAKKGRDANIALAREQGAAAIADKLLPKLLAAQTLTARPDVTNAARALMARQPVEGIVAALTAMRERPDSTPLLAEIAVPTRVIVGADDALMPPKESESMASAIRGATLTRVPDAGHLSNYEQPDAFNQAVREFLKSV